MSRYVVKKASECPPNIIVIPFPDETGAESLARNLNKSLDNVEGWCRGPAGEYVYEDGDESWVVVDTQAVQP